MKKIFYLLFFVSLIASHADGQNRRHLLNSTPFEFDDIWFKTVMRPPRDTTSIADSSSFAIKNGKPYVKWGSWKEIGAPENDMDVFGLWDDSNGQGWGISALSEVLPAGIMYQFYNELITNKTTDPIGNANTGSFMPAFAKTWYAITGRKICFIPVGIPGSTMNATADVGNGNWDTTGSSHLFDTASARTQRGLAALTAAGWTPNFKGILTGLGGNDALAINATTITQANYITSFTKFKARIRSLFGKNTPIYIHQLGKQVTGTDAGHALIRSAQITLTNADSLTTINFWNAQYFISLGKQTDQYHYTQAGYNEFGRMYAENILNSGGRKLQAQGSNLYFPIGNVGIGTNAGIPLYPLHVTDSARIGSLIISREGFAGAPSIRSASTYLTFLSDQDLFIFQPIGTHPAEIRGGQNAAGLSGTGSTPFTLVINGFNFGAGGTPDIRRHLFITTSGTNVGASQRAGNIILMPGTAYVVSTNTFQYGKDSVIVQLNSGATMSILGGKLYANDSVQFTNIPAGGTTGDSIAVITSSGVVKRMDPARITGGGGGSSDHATLTNLSWIASAHTGTANKLAGWDASNVPVVYSATSPLSLSGSAISITDAAADGSTKGAASFTANDFNASSGNISIDYTNGQAASGSVNGFVTTGTQTLAGAKTFTSLISGIGASWTPSSDNQNTITVRNNAGNPVVQIGTANGGATYGGLWMGNVTPSLPNAVFFGNGTQTIFNGMNEIFFRIGNVSSPASALYINPSAQVGINVNPTARFEVLATSNQMRIDYDGSTYWSTTVGSTGNVVWDAIGSGARFTLSDGITFAAGTTAAGTSPTKFISGPLMTTIEAGAREYNNAHYSSTNALNRYAQGGAIADFISDVQNTTTGETDLYTYTTKASTLAANGEKIIAEYTGINLGHATATRQVKVYFAGTQIFDGGATTNAATLDWKLRVTVIRTGSSTVRTSVDFITTNAGVTTVNTDESDLGGVTFTNTNIIKVTGQAGATGAATGDITAKLGTIFWYGSANN